MPTHLISAISLASSRRPSRCACCAAASTALDAAAWRALSSASLVSLASCGKNKNHVLGCAREQAVWGETAASQDSLGSTRASALS